MSAAQTAVAERIRCESDEGQRWPTLLRTGEGAWMTQRGEHVGAILADPMMAVHGPIGFTA